MKHGQQLRGVGRCPHCGTATPTLPRLWASAVSGLDNKNPRFWGAYSCTTCGGVVLASSGAPILPQTPPHDGSEIEAIYPRIRQAAAELPDAARHYLQQAYEILNAPDAAAMIAGSAVDAMLKEKGYVDGSLYSRIDKAVADRLLTSDMGDWAHWVRLGSNRPRHADKDTPHVSPEEAKASVEFAEALGQFLYVHTARIKAGIKRATQAGEAPT